MDSVKLTDTEQYRGSTVAENYFYRA